MDRLLTLLNENARLTTKQLAVMLNETEENVSNAITEYEKNGVIRGYKAIINWEKVDGNNAIAIIELSYFIVWTLFGKPKILVRFCKKSPRFAGFCVMIE